MRWNELAVNDRKRPPRYVAEATLAKAADGTGIPTFCSFLKLLALFYTIEGNKVQIKDQRT